MEKTTYVVGKGTQPNVRKGAGPAEIVPSKGAPMLVVGVIAVIAALVALAYLVGIMR